MLKAAPRMQHRTVYTLTTLTTQSTAHLLLVARWLAAPSDVPRPAWTRRSPVSLVAAHLERHCGVTPPRHGSPCMLTPSAPAVRQQAADGGG